MRFSKQFTPSIRNLKPHHVVYHRRIKIHLIFPNTRKIVHLAIFLSSKLFVIKHPIKANLPVVRKYPARIIGIFVVSFAICTGPSIKLFLKCCIIKSHSTVDVSNEVFLTQANSRFNDITIVIHNYRVKVEKKTCKSFVRFFFVFLIVIVIRA